MTEAPSTFVVAGLMVAATAGSATTVAITRATESRTGARPLQKSIGFLANARLQPCKRVLSGLQRDEWLRGILDITWAAEARFNGVQVRQLPQAGRGFDSSRPVMWPRSRCLRRRERALRQVGQAGLPRQDGSGSRGGSGSAGHITCADAKYLPVACIAAEVHACAVPMVIEVAPLDRVADEIRV